MARTRTCLILATLLVASFSPRLHAQPGMPPYPQQTAPISAQPAPPRTFPYRITTQTLENGLTVASIPFDSPGIVAYYTIVRAGSRNEVEPGLSGFAHFFEHMMFRGTPKYPQDRYNSILKSLGADSNAFTYPDWTCYHMTVPASALATVVELEADRFQNLKYDEAAFQKEARAVLGEYNKSASSPSLLLRETMQAQAFTTHTYRHTTIGFLADVRAMPEKFAYSKVFFDRWYRPENCTLVVAGDVDHGRLMSLVRTHYGGWKRGATKLEIPVEPPQTKPRSATLSWPLPTQPTLAMGYHIPSGQPSSVDMAALFALSQAVFGETSPIFKSLVLDEQKVTSLEAEAEWNRDPGLFTVVARLRDPADLPEVRSRLESALVSAAREPIAVARLITIKEHAVFEFASSLDSADAVARTVGHAIATTGKADVWNTWYDTVERLTVADLQRVAERYLVPSNQTVVTLISEAKAP
ncbi:MAG: pitrilysin family protein [Isosphaeraceae bacterium]